jgi:hypothetical protein
LKEKTVFWNIPGRRDAQIGNHRFRELHLLCKLPVVACLSYTRRFFFFMSSSSLCLPLFNQYINGMDNYFYPQDLWLDTFIFEN